MIAFCESLTGAVKGAESEEEVRGIVENSIILFRATRTRSRESDFILNMIVTLQVVMTENLSLQQVLNVKEAIALFRSHQKRSPGTVL